MGSCCGLFKSDGFEEQPSNQGYQQPDRERLRELQAQAAEKRIQENAKKGLKDPEALRRAQAKRDQHNKQAYSANNEGLRWQVS